MLALPVHFSHLEAFHQLVRLNIYQFNLIGLSENISGIRSLTAMPVMEDAKSLSHSKCCTFTVV